MHAERARVESESPAGVRHREREILLLEEAERHELAAARPVAAQIGHEHGYPCEIARTASGGHSAALPPLPWRKTIVRERPAPGRPAPRRRPRARPDRRRAGEPEVVDARARFERAPRAGPLGGPGTASGLPGRDPARPGATAATRRRRTPRRPAGDRRAERGAWGEGISFLPSGEDGRVGSLEWRECSLRRFLLLGRVFPSASSAAEPARRGLRTSAWSPSRRARGRRSPAEEIAPRSATPDSSSGSTGVLVVDTFATEEGARELLAAIRGATPLPIRWVVNTHYHLDHVGGNAVFRREGAVVVAHENVRRWARTENLKWRKEITASDRAMLDALVLPDVTHTDRVTLSLGDRDAEVLFRPGPHGRRLDRSRRVRRRRLRRRSLLERDRSEPDRRGHGGVGRDARRVSARFSLGHVRRPATASRPRARRPFLPRLPVGAARRRSAGGHRERAAQDRPWSTRLLRDASAAVRRVDVVRRVRRVERRTDRAGNAGTKEICSIAPFAGLPHPDRESRPPTKEIHDRHSVRKEHARFAGRRRSGFVGRAASAPAGAPRRPRRGDPPLRGVRRPGRATARAAARPTSQAETFAIPIGGAKELGGCGKGANSEEMLLAAVGTCWIGTWAIFLKKLGVPYPEPRIRLTGELGKDPAGGFRMTGHDDLSPGFRRRFSRRTAPAIEKTVDARREVLHHLEGREGGDAGRSRRSRRSRAAAARPAGRNTDDAPRFRSRTRSISTRSCRGTSRRRSTSTSARHAPPGSARSGSSTARASASGGRRSTAAARSARTSSEFFDAPARARRLGATIVRLRPAGDLT